MVLAPLQQLAQTTKGLRLRHDAQPPIARREQRARRQQILGGVRRRLDREQRSARQEDVDVVQGARETVADGLYSTWSKTKRWTGALRWRAGRLRTLLSGGTTHCHMRATLGRRAQPGGAVMA